MTGIASRLAFPPEKPINYFLKGDYKSNNNLDAVRYTKEGREAHISTCLKLIRQYVTTMT